MESALIIKTIRRCRAITLMTMVPGQVLHYSGQIPLGIYLFTKGALELKLKNQVPGSDPNQILDAKKNLFLFPHPGSLNESCFGNAVILRKSEIYFIPRSVFYNNLTIRRTLESLG